MKRIVSVSLGSSKRDKTVTATVLGEEFELQRIGCNGDAKEMMRRISELDGKVDAFGLGGTDLYLFVGGKRYPIRDAVRIASAAKRTPMFDGSYLKNTWEKRVIMEVHRRGIVDFAASNVLMPASTDRPGMAEVLASISGRVLYGDVLFGLGLPIPIYSAEVLRIIGTLFMPIVAKLPFSWLYPTGEKQDMQSPKHRRFFEWADVIAGDWHYIRRNMPEDMTGKTVISNTLTDDDVDVLRKRGAKTLITTTPEFDGRSFGTNVMEAAIAIAAGLDPKNLSFAQFEEVLDRVDFEPRILPLQTTGEAGVAHSKA